MEGNFENETEKYFANYNEHYLKMQQWFYNHEKLLSKIDYKYCYCPNDVREKKESSNDQTRNGGHIKQRNRSQAYLLRKKAKKKLKRKQNQLERKKMNERLSASSAGYGYDDEIDNDEDDNDDEKFEMHISEEMRQFFEISAKHREERNKALNQNPQSKPEKESQETTKPMDSNADNINNDITDINHIEKPGEARMKEMKELYGEGAAKIHAMETAMQLTFNRNFDQKLPKLWPALPLNIKFD